MNSQGKENKDSVIGELENEVYDLRFNHMDLESRLNRIFGEYLVYQWMIAFVQMILVAMKIGGFLDWPWPAIVAPVLIHGFIRILIYLLRN